MNRRFACACGRRVGSASGEPRSVTACHCADCRRESGAPFFVWVGYANENVNWPDGLTMRSTKPNVSRERCADCGATLGYRDAGLPDAVYIPLGAFDEQEALVPTEHAYWPERPAWLTVADDLPKRDATTQSRVAASQHQAHATH